MSDDGRADSTAQVSVQDVEKGLDHSTRPDRKNAGSSNGSDKNTEVFDKEAPALEAKEAESRDPNIVDWEGDDDPHNPMNWTTKRKWGLITLISAITFNASMASTVFAPGVPAAQKEFHSDSGAETSLLVSVYVIGLIFGPLFLTPMSEHYGRAIVVHVSNFVFLVASILCAVAVNLPMLIVFRLVMGLACSVPMTIGGGIIADLVEREKRGKALSMWVIGPLMGPVVGPVAGGYLSLEVSWRWTLWLVAIVQAVLIIASLIFMRETYAPRLLELKTRRLRKETGNANLLSNFDKGQSTIDLFRLALIRPAKMIVRSPIVLILSLIISVTYSYCYVLFSTITEVFEGGYGFNSGEAGLAYLGLGAGFCIGQLTAGSFSDWHLARQKAKNGESTPEDRLPPLALGALCLPIGLFWYGWTAEYHTHWIVPIIGTSFCGLGIMYTYLPIQLYLVDAYTLFAASALAANTVIRSIFATCIPLAAPALYQRLGLGWGNSLLGFISLALAPFSLIILKYGERIRKNPKFQPNL